MSNKNTDNLEMSKKKNMKKTIIVIFLIVITTFIILLLLNKCSKKESVNELELDENQGMYKEQENTAIHSKNIVMPGWGSFTIPKDTTVINQGIDLFNPKSNAWYKCPDCDSQLDDNFKCINEKCGHVFDKDSALQDCYYMSFGLYLEDNDELLYQSKLVSPGNHLQNITISRSLSEGEYNAYIFIQPYKSNKATACNNGKVKIKLFVK